MKRILFLLTVISVGAFSLHWHFENASAQTARGQRNDQTASKDPVRDNSFDRLISEARTSGQVRVIVGLRMDHKPLGELDAPDREQQSRDIKAAQQGLRSKYSSLIGEEGMVLFDHIPFMAFAVDAVGLGALRNAPQAASMEEAAPKPPALLESTGVVSAPPIWTAGGTGSGWAVAVLDTGVDKNHNFLAGKVVSEACYSQTVGDTSVSVCPGGVSQTTASDSGLHCSLAVNGCNHGTHVAGIAAGTGPAFHGVARGADIIAIQVFSRFNLASNCGSTPTPCVLSYVSDQIRGLERVLALSDSIDIASVNMSLGGGNNPEVCDATQAARKAAVDNLRSVGIATVASSGNNGFTNAMGAPACISSVISVGSTGDGSLGATLDVVVSSSNSASFLDLLAPGRWINSAVPSDSSTNTFANFSGTSMAAPHVAGAMAIMKQRSPEASVDRMLNALSSTGLPITDARNSIIKPRINVNAAVQALLSPAAYDFDGDRRADISIFRPTGGSGTSEWWYLRSSDGDNRAFGFGASTDVMVPGDYTGDGKADIAFWRPSTGEWFVLRSEDGSFFAFPFGGAGDIPAPADYDGDGITDAAVFRPSTGTWFVLRSSDQGVSIVSFGSATDRPVPADFDGDGKADIAIYRPLGETGGGEWWYIRSSDGTARAFAFGQPTDKALPADYTGDGVADVAFFRPSTGEWYVLRSEDNSYFAFPFGNAADSPVPGDYDGDGQTDPAVFRPSTGIWFILRSTEGLQIVNFGSPGDMAVPNAYVR